MLSEIINTLSSLGWEIVVAFSDFFYLLKDTTISEFLTADPWTWNDSFVSWILANLGINDYTLLELLLGSGLSILVVVTLVKWVIGIVT